MGGITCQQRLSDLVTIVKAQSNFYLGGVQVNVSFSQAVAGVLKTKATKS